MLAKMILRDNCSTSYELAFHSFVAVKSLNALARGRQVCSPLSVSEGNIAQLLRFDVLVLSDSKIEEVEVEVSQTYFLSDRRINR